MDEQMQALRESMELLASFHRDMEVKFDAHQAQMARLITRLTATVVDHEDRIRRIEESL